MERNITAERVAENESVFREANERIRGRARELDFDSTVPFLCECGDPQCHEIVRLPPADYERVRKRGTSFLVAPGHDRAEGPSSRVRERRDGYAIVEKVDEAGDVARSLDPRH